MDEYTITNWTPWSERLGIPGIKHPGVYLMAHFDTMPTTQVDPTDPAIVYIGETCRSLRGRWNSFHRAINDGKRGHTGGLSYHAAFTQQSTESFKDRLYVAAITVPINEPQSSALIRFIERKLILDFVQLHHRYPQCNSK